MQSQTDMRASLRVIRRKFAPRVAEVAASIHAGLQTLIEIDEEMRKEAVDANVCSDREEQNFYLSYDHGHEADCTTFKEALHMAAVVMNQATDEAKLLAESSSI
jgi:hypothetical protein